MNRAVMDKWTEALRSGQYKQAATALHTEAGYCCLGVLCEVAVKEGVVPDYWGLSSYPSEVVLGWVGISNQFTREVARLNDVDGLSFSQIADTLDRYAEVLCSTT